MGKIEEIIFENYKHSIEIGNLDQAKKALELANALKQKIESENFNDYDSLKVPSSMVLGKYFNPFPYTYNYKKGLVKLENSVILLTGKENELFNIFSNNQTSGIQINILTKQELINKLWGKKNISKNALRILVHRLRKKIELDHKHPRIIVNLHNKGYVFLGKYIT